MKNKIISIIAGLFLVLLPQLSLAAESSKNGSDDGKAPRGEKTPAEGSAAGSAAAKRAAGGVSAGTIAAIVANNAVH